MTLNFPINTYFLSSDGNGLLALDAQGKVHNLLGWIKEYKTLLDEALLRYGGILLRNFNINSISEFNSLAQTISPNLLDYTFRSTPRTRLGGKIYTATEYPADRTIPLHNENSYSRSWPRKILFFSAVWPLKEEKHQL